jgi:hypothetical protein
VAKVKKGTGLTGERNKSGKGSVGGKRALKSAKRASPGKAARPPRSARKSAGKKVKSTRKSAVKGSAGAKPADKRKTKAASAKKASVLVRGRKATAGSLVKIDVKALDPLRKCGPNTTVELLYRVDETVDGRSTPHLVFFDRHGWYCEHGRTCPAVGHAKKYNGQIARVS